MDTSTASTTDVLNRVLADTPDVLAELTAAHEAATASIDPRLFELCRLRIAMLLGTPNEDDSDVVPRATIDQLAAWPTSDLFTDTDRVCLAFTEQFIVDVASLPDAMAEAVSDHLGPAGFADFVNALLVIEQRQRLRLVWGRLLHGAPA